MSRFVDVHAEKRKALSLFQAVEPCVELVGNTQIVRDGYVFPDKNAENGVSAKDGLLHPNEIPGYIARMSHASTGGAEANVKLTKKLIQFDPPHKTPFEFMQWIFKITGISKSCLTQMDRNRVGVGFVQMSGRYMDRSQSGFIYTAFAEKEWRGTEEGGDDAFSSLLFEQDENRSNLEAYEKARNCYKMTKQDSRKRLPVAQATGTYVYWNSSSLRGFFNERLRPQAEWEIRRIAQMMFDIVYAIAPTHFEDIKKMLDHA